MTTNPSVEYKNGGFLIKLADYKFDLSVNNLDLNLLAWLFEGTKLLFTQDQSSTGNPHRGKTPAIVIKSNFIYKVLFIHKMQVKVLCILNQIRANTHICAPRT